MPDWGNGRPSGFRLQRASAHSQFKSGVGYHKIFDKLKTVGAAEWPATGLENRGSWDNPAMEFDSSTYRQIPRVTRTVRDRTANAANVERREWVRLPYSRPCTCGREAIARDCSSCALRGGGGSSPSTYTKFRPMAERQTRLAQNECQSPGSNPGGPTKYGDVG